jgi:hypothetical protein
MIIKYNYNYNFYLNFNIIFLNYYIYGSANIILIVTNERSFITFFFNKGRMI